VTAKLRLLDLALLVIAGLLGMQLRREWIDSHTRNLVLVRSSLPSSAVPGLAPLDKVGPVSVIDFVDVAMKNLFSKDRNPNVIVDQVAPPPPKPVPPFPVAHGVMLWDGVPPTIVLSESAASQQKGYHPGDTVGPWKLVALDSRYVDFEWDGKKFKKRIDELIDREPIAEVAPPPPAAAPKSGPQVLSTPTAPGKPGLDTGGGYKGCAPGDPSPSGTVSDGMRKVVTATPFGNSCQWEPVK
jgi:hypothetical protein